MHSMDNLIKSLWPWYAAKWIGAIPLWFLDKIITVASVLTPAPPTSPPSFYNNISAACVHPAWQHKCNGVSPEMFTQLLHVLEGSALSWERCWYVSNRLTTSCWCRTTAKCSGVQPSSLVSLILAPLSNNNCTTFTWPFQLAWINGVSPVRNINFER